MGGTSTISGGKLCLRIDPRVPTLSGCAASRGPTIKANTVPFSWIMTSIHEGLVKDWQRTQLAGYISKSLQIMRLSCSERRLAPLDSWIGQSGLRSLDVFIDGRHGRHITKQRTPWPADRLRTSASPIHSVQCSPDRHSPLVKVDVRPFEPECLTAPQTHRQRNRPQCIQSVLFCGP